MNNFAFFATVKTHYWQTLAKLEPLLDLFGLGAFKFYSSKNQLDRILRKLRILFFCILPGLVISPMTYAESVIPEANPNAHNSITILQVQDYQKNKQLLIDSESVFNLPPKVIEAIHHEIALSFKIQIELTEKTNLLGFNYQRTRNLISYNTDIYAYGVNRTYALYNNRNQKAESFRTIDEALTTLATLQAFPIASLSELHPEQMYTLRMRISLDFWKLPAPLLLEALLAPSVWQLDSQWYETTLQTPLSWQ
ncbi:DUF4390 domain-containing protein [Thiomicrorhabdus sp.]|uniref:DUF4390 domain-containing protein n=1 Tax=Thiomicrorhabdus sp. TaxID=2039724 RepID=UPI002AA8D721|nr:DUF4390 domain-containing protein [Thiomicrorhabdus sp.]